MTFSQELLSTHNCPMKFTEKFSCPGCNNLFTSNESLKIHLQVDHKVNEDEMEKFLINFTSITTESSNPKIHIVDYQLLKKSDSDLTNKPKSKIFIKDVTLLRKPDLPNDINLPNIFDSLDLTTTEDDIFDDFLGTDDAQIFEDDFDFDDPVVVEPMTDVEIVGTHESPIATNDLTNNLTPSSSGKIFVRKNLCSESNDSNSQEETVKVTDGAASKIYVRSHESLTSQISTQQPPESSTPDCVIVSEESEAPQNKIFIRDIETLTNPQQTQENVQYFPPNASSNSFLDNSFTATPFAPAIYVRSYDSMVQETLSDTTTNSQCKISIKNMNTLIEPTLMHPPLINNNIFGQAQNLVIHMRPNQTPDESLAEYRDTSVTPDTIPGSSNVSICTDNDVIILDDSEINEASFAVYTDLVDKPSTVDVNEHFQHKEVVIENTLENSERNDTQTPNNKPKIVENGDVIEEDQPMTRIPINIEVPSSSPPAVEKKATKKLKILKILRVKKKLNENAPNSVQVVFKCNIDECLLHFPTANLVNYHKKCHSPSNNHLIICPECKCDEFKNFNSLHTHLWRQHQVDMNLHSCHLCNFKTPFLSRLKNFHLKIHSNEKNYKCEFPNCNKRFKNSKQLKNHSQIHVNKRKNKPINTIETDEKKIKCGICNKKFSSESGLYIHFNEHKGEEKRFVCEEKECEYSTNDHNSFRRHKFQHSKTHQYSCPACDYSSIQSSTYRKHLEKQHKELAETLLFKCRLCKFITISKSKYDGHLTSKHASLSDS